MCKEAPVGREMSAIAKSLWYPMPNAQSCTQVILGPLKYLLYCLVSTFIARIRKGRSEDTTDFSDTDLLFDLNSTRSSNATTKMLSAKPMPVLFFFSRKFLSAFPPFVTYPLEMSIRRVKRKKSEPCSVWCLSALWGFEPWIALGKTWSVWLSVPYQSCITNLQ